MHSPTPRSLRSRGLPFAKTLARELDDELKRGAWYVLDPEPELLLPRKTEGMWQRLLQRAELREKGI